MNKKSPHYEKSTEIMLRVTLRFITVVILFYIVMSGIAIGFIIDKSFGGAFVGFLFSFFIAGALYIVSTKAAHSDDL